ncbi:MAG: pyrroline-5-carboxylate reductase [Bacteroidota bacterium]
MKIAIIGTGNLGLSIAKGILSADIADNMYLTKRKLSELDDFKSYANVSITSDNTEAIVNSDVLIFAVQPHHIEAILNSHREQITEKHLVVSTITGYSIQQIENNLNAGVSVVRAMPNTAIAVAKSMTCICSNETGESQLKTVETIFNTLGTTLVIPETQMQAATVVCASGIAFWMRLIRASTQAAIQLGFDSKEAQQLAMHTCEGAAQLLISTGNHPEEEIDKVTTPKGCTISGLNEMEHRGLSSSLIKGMVASFQKIDDIK